MTQLTEETSREAWEAYKARGMITTSILQVLETMDAHGGAMNQRMIDEEVCYRFSRARGSGQKSVYLMERMGLLEEVEKRLDPATGNSSVYYRLTYRKPSMSAKAASVLGFRQTTISLRHENRQLRLENMQLRAELAQCRNGRDSCTPHSQQLSLF